MVLLLISQTFLFPFFILTGRLSRILLECRTEITRSGKSGFLCNFREGHIRAGYQCNSFSIRSLLIYSFAPMPVSAFSLL